VLAAGSRVWSPMGGIVAGGTVLLGSTAAIWLRGYLVPGTPVLTKRYFPDRMLSWFGKAGSDGTTHSDPEGSPSAREVDPETVLVRVGALEACRRGEDLCLTDDFRRAWYDAVERVEADDAGRGRLLDVLDVGDGDVRFQDHGAAFAAHVDDERVGTWESRPAFLADVGAAAVLADRVERWDDLAVGPRSTLLNGLRLFIDECPGCGGRPAFGTETVESCCSTHEVAAVECQDCDARLFESDPI
ncbi:MAG: hypothetical protein V5A18_07825, partial [Haloarculaceae archaeon]